MKFFEKVGDTFQSCQKNFAIHPTWGTTFCCSYGARSPHSPIRLSLKAGSHVRRKHKRKRKHKEVHTSNANASTVQYASAIEYSKMVDEVDVLVLLFFLFLGLRRIRRRRLIQRNNKSRPVRLWVREIFRKRQLFPFLSQHLPF